MDSDSGSDDDDDDDEDNKQHRKKKRQKKRSQQQLTVSKLDGSLNMDHDNQELHRLNRWLKTQSKDPPGTQYFIINN